MKTKISHEIPIQLFPYHNFINDYPYLLGHLLDSNETSYNKVYADFYKKTVGLYEYSILDNSAFELNDSIDAETLYNLGEEYKTSHIILPDKLHDMEETKRRCIEYIYKYSKKSTPKFMAVVQGNTFKELSEMFDLYNSLSEVDVIAFPFDTLPSDAEDFSDWDLKLRRVEVIKQLLRGNRGKKIKKIHLLGCASPSEFSYYDSEFYGYIYSLDTSAPIIYGWNKTWFEEVNLLALDTPKPKDKLAENLDIYLDSDQLCCIAHNIREFRKSLHI